MLLLTGAAALAACGPAADQGAGARPDAIRVVSLPFISQAPIAIAHAEGFFDEQRLDVELVKLARNLEAVPALARGEVDVGVGQLTVNVVNAIAGGEHLRLVAGSGFLDPNGCTYNAIMARRELVETGGLARPEQLRGLKVELDTLLPAAFYVSRLLEPAGLTIDDLDVVNLPMPTNIDAIVNGSIDVTVASEPYVTRLVNSGQVVAWRASNAIAPGFQVSTVMFGPTLLDERPDVGRRFVAAFLKGVRRFREGRTARNVEIVSAATGLDRALVEQMCWPSQDPNGRVHPDGLIEFQAWLQSRGLIDAVLPMDRLVDERFIDYANSVVANEGS